SRGAPHYFFRSKEGLYQAVLERAMAPVYEQARIFTNEVSLAASTTKAGRDIARSIETYFDFLVANPRLIRLTQWAALEHGRTLADLTAKEAAVGAGGAGLPAGA